MKHLLKPTGQLLTTAVFTSTAIDANLPQVADPMPLDSSSPETTPTPEQPTIDAADVAEQQETIAPPEAIASHQNSVVQTLPERLPSAEMPAPLPAEFFAELSRPQANPALANSPAANESSASNASASIGTETPALSPEAQALSLATPSVQVFLPESAHEEPQGQAVDRVNAAATDQALSVLPSNAADNLGETETPPIAASPNAVLETSRDLDASEETSEFDRENRPIELDVSLIQGETVQNTSLQDELHPAEKDTTHSQGQEIGLNSSVSESIPIPRSTTPIGQDSLASERAGQESAQELEKDPVTNVSATEDPLARELTPHDLTQDFTASTPDEASSQAEVMADALVESNSTTTVNANAETSANSDPTAGSEDELQETRDWLDQQLAAIVKQSRQRELTDSRTELIEQARQALENGSGAEARQIAENPILSEEEQDALSTAIAKISPTNGFIPLIPLDSALNIIGLQPSSSPAWNALPTLPTTPLMTPIPLRSGTAIASSSTQLPSLPLASSQRQWPLATETGIPDANSLTAEELKHCLVGDTDLTVDPLANDLSNNPSPSNSIMDGASPRISLEPMTYIGTGQQPPSNLKASDSYPVGGDFLAGVGQQPPSILPESSWAGGPVLSAEPVPFKWTRSKLNQELDAISSSTTPKTMSPECRAALSNRPATRSPGGGPTVASLTGYDWLSQFTSSRSAGASNSAAAVQQPTQMILPLPSQAPMTSGFGWRSHPIHGGRRFHFGLDYGAPSGTPILASVSGRIETTGSLSGYGLTVVLENEDLNLRNLYAHMSAIAVQEGAWVEQGTVIGWVGSTGNSTGPHLHFEVHQQTDEGWVAVDPLKAAAELLQVARR